MGPLTNEDEAPPLDEDDGDVFTRVRAEDDYERALLGAVLGGYTDLPALTRIVSGRDFRRVEHEAIWNAALAVHKAGDIPDPLTVRAKLGSRANRLPGGPVYLVGLDCPVVLQARFYAEKVWEASVKRQIAAVGRKFTQLVDDDDMHPKDMLARVRKWMDEFGHGETGDLVSIDKALEEVIDVAEHGEPNGSHTAWPTLDDMIGGWFPGQFIVIGARPGVGKSIFLENAATHAAREHGQHVLFVSLEMTAKELTQRTLAHTARVQLTKIRKGVPVDDPDWDRITEAYRRISSAHITFSEDSNVTIDDIRALAWQAHQTAVRQGERLSLLVVDYAQLVAPLDPRSNRVTQIGEVTRGLKRLAKELGITILSGAQLNRETEKRSNPLPILADLREAGDLEQDADVVIFLHEEYVEEGGKKIPTGDLMVIVAKQRNGPLSMHRFQKYGHYGKIV